MFPHPLQILIIGSSIAGPSTAYWLARTNNTCTITVIDRYPHRLRPGGQAVDLRHVGVTVMRRIPGMEALVRAHGTGEEGVSFVRENGRAWGVVGKSGDVERQSIVSEFEIFRGRLAEILVRLGKEVVRGEEGRVRYVFGESVVSMWVVKGGDGKVGVEFSGALGKREFDLVVGCDGAHSRTRTMALQCGIRDHVVPSNCWAAYFSIKEDLLRGSRVSKGISAVGGRFVSLGPDPEGGNRVMLMCVQARNKNKDALLGFRETVAQGDRALREYVAEVFRDVGWKTPLLLQHLMKAEDFYASEIVQVKPPTLHNGRIVLVGDAGYAAGTAGSGTSLALAGAYILAGEISSHEGDLEAALRAYEERMKPIIKELQWIPPLVPWILAPQTSWGIWIRNLLFAFIAWSRIVEVAQILGNAVASSETFPLPAYGWSDGSESSQTGE